MENTATFIALEVTEKEMKEVLERREAESKKASIGGKANEIAKLVREINELGGSVRVNRNYTNHYFGSYGAKVLGIKSIFGHTVEILID